MGMEELLLHQPVERGRWENCPVVWLPHAGERGVLAFSFMRGGGTLFLLLPLSKLEQGLATFLLPQTGAHKSLPS